LWQHEIAEANNNQIQATAAIGMLHLCKTHGGSNSTLLRLQFRKGRCNGCAYNMQSKCRWNSLPALIYSTMYIKEFFTKNHSETRLKRQKRSQKNPSRVPLNLFRKCVHGCKWCRVLSSIVMYTP